MSPNQTAIQAAEPSKTCHADEPAHFSEAKTKRSQINRANAQHSTGPKSSLGKLRSSQNSFQHGLYSKQLILPNEDPAEFDHLRATLRNEHQPANTTEEILVDELAQHFWRMRRFRELEARAFQPENLDDWCNNGLMTLIQRSMASAERGFHKSLTSLEKLQKARGFVPSHLGETGFVPSNSVAQTVGQTCTARLLQHETIGSGRLSSAEHPDQAEIGFVPSNSCELQWEGGLEPNTRRSVERSRSEGFEPVDIVTAKVRYEDGHRQGFSVQSETGEASN